MSKSSNSQKQFSLYEKMYGKTLASHIQKAEWKLTSKIGVQTLQHLCTKTVEGVEGFEAEVAETRREDDMDAIADAFMYYAPVFKEKREEYIKESPKKNFTFEDVTGEQDFPMYALEITKRLHSEDTAEKFASYCKYVWDKGWPEEEIQKYRDTAHEIAIQIVDTITQLLLYCERQSKSCPSAIMQRPAPMIPVIEPQKHIPPLRSAGTVKASLQKFPDNVLLWSTVARSYLILCESKLTAKYTQEELFYAFIYFKSKTKQTSELHVLLFHQLMNKQAGDVSSYWEHGLDQYYKEAMKDSKTEKFDFDQHVPIPIETKRRIPPDMMMKTIYDEMAEFAAESESCKLPLKQDYTTPRSFVSRAMPDRNIPLLINPARRKLLEDFGYTPQDAAALDAYISTSLRYQTLERQQAMLYNADRFRTIKALEQTHHSSLEREKEQGIAQSELDAIQSELTTAQTQQMKHAKENRSLSHDLQEALSIIKAQDEEIENLKEKIAELESTAQNMDELLAEHYQINEFCTSSEDDNNDDENSQEANWPSDIGKNCKVICYGGAEKWLKVLQQRFPYVVFHNADELPKETEIVHADYIFVNTFVLAHKFFWVIQNVAKRNKIKLYFFDSRGVSNCSAKILETVQAS